MQRENGLVPIPKSLPRQPSVHGPAAAHFDAHKSCELCEKNRCDNLWQMRMGGSEGWVAVCDPCAKRVERQGYFMWKGMKIIVLEETPPGVADIVKENYSPHAAKWIAGRQPDDGA